MARLDAHMEELLRKYLRNELTSEQRRELEEAMATDSSVRERLEELKASLREEKRVVRDLDEEKKRSQTTSVHVETGREKSSSGFGRYAMPLLALGLLLGLGALLLPNLGRKKESAEVESPSTDQELLDERRRDLEESWDDQFDESFEERMKDIGDDVDKRLEGVKDEVDKKLDDAGKELDKATDKLKEKTSSPVYDGVGQRYSLNADGKFIPDDNGDYFLGLDGKYYEIK